MARLKNEKFKGVAVGFFKSDGKVFARGFGHGTFASGKTKKDAFENAKSEIKFLKKRGNI